MIGRRVFEIDVSDVPAKHLEGFLMGVRATIKAKPEEEGFSGRIFKVTGFERGVSSLHMIGKKSDRHGVENHPDRRLFLICTDPKEEQIYVEVGEKTFQAAIEELPVRHVPPSVE